jgi:hypothetical protein
VQEYAVFVRFAMVGDTAPQASHWLPLSCQYFWCQKRCRNIGEQRWGNQKPSERQKRKRQKNCALMMAVVAFLLLKNPRQAS